MSGDDVYMYEVGGYDGRFWLQYSGAAARPPELMGLGPSLEWARRHGARIRIAVGGVEYSAGSEPILGLPVWDDSIEVRARHFYEAPGTQVRAYWAVVVFEGPLPEGLIEVIKAAPDVLETRLVDVDRLECLIVNGELAVDDRLDDLVDGWSQAVGVATGEWDHRWSVWDVRPWPGELSDREVLGRAGRRYPAVLDRLGRIRLPAARADDVAARIAAGDGVTPAETVNEPTPQVQLSAGGWQVSWFEGSDEIWLNGEGRTFSWRFESTDAATVAGWLAWFAETAAEDSIAVGTFHNVSADGGEPPPSAEALIRLSTSDDRPWSELELFGIAEHPEPPGALATGWPANRDAPSSGLVARLARNGAFGTTELQITTERPADNRATWTAIPRSEPE